MAILTLICYALLVYIVKLHPFISEFHNVKCRISDSFCNDDSVIVVFFSPSTIIKCH